ncbi:4Fe-4S binding protein [Carboxylicivirga sp. N1Y90]|uniref:4Fe-4S binding protein n=1 Tax=Carboxylicivirga fragile TaxID=3417571 RepID=UPI003D340296|nr:4Fe-4S binding protein [Marinilabiliaceae bacterium N1Y90]
MLQNTGSALSNNRKVHAIFFSPARSTKKIVEAIASGISDEFIIHDITQGLHKTIELKADDIAVVGVPAFSGKVPPIAAQLISKIKGQGARAIVACAYGNCHYEDTLSELSNICVKAGFVPISSGAFVSRHSMFPELGKGRPDENDLAKARTFGKQSVKHSRITLKGELDTDIIPSNRPKGVVPAVVKSTSDCNFCNICTRSCPTGAISRDNPKKTDKKKCIACARCIEMCPYEARKFKGLMYQITKKRFVEKHQSRKENEINLPL